MNLTTQTVLLVDDCLEDRITYRRYLSYDRHHSYNILEAETGEEAFLLCKQHLPDLTLPRLRFAKDVGFLRLVQL